MIHQHKFTNIKDMDAVECACGKVVTGPELKLSPKHPVTKAKLVGGFDPLDVSGNPFGFRETVKPEWSELLARPVEGAT